MGHHMGRGALAVVGHHPDLLGLQHQVAHGGDQPVGAYAHAVPGAFRAQHPRR